MLRSGLLFVMWAAFACVFLAFAAPCDNVVVSTVAGVGGDPTGNRNPGPALSAHFHTPRSIAAADDGSVIIAEDGAIRKLSADGTTVSTIAGPSAFDTFGYADGIGDQARFQHGLRIAVVGDSIYVTDPYAKRIRKVTMNGVTTTYAGTGSAAITQGPLATAAVGDAVGITVDPVAQVLYFTTGNFLPLVRKIDMAAGMVMALAGGGEEEFADGVGPAARFYFASDLALYSSGDVVVADTANARVRKIAVSTATVTTIAGTGDPSSVDNADPLLATIANPLAVVVDGANSIFVSCLSDNNIRKIDGASGAVTTIAGLSGEFMDGSGCTATFFFPSGLALRGSTLFVADTANNRIRSVGDPVAPTPCDSIDSSCTALDAQCTILHNGNHHPSVATNCDDTAAACHNVHQDCLTKFATCPVV
jgi:hypothetical protein